METPSSTRTAASSHISAAPEKIKQEDSNSRPRNGSLLDITNDSPIVGVAAAGLGEKTPSSAIKNRAQVKQTPGSGESLLRGQVKTLLQKVEEETELSGPPSAAQILASAPPNTPEIKEDVLMASADSDQNIQSEVVENLKELDGSINRALLFDSPEKSEGSDSSTILYQVIRSKRERVSEDDSSSVWSLQANASIQEDDDKETEDYEEEVEVEEEEDCGECVEDGEGFDDLCDGLMKMSVADKAKLPEFAGKHTRFIYNSDDEIEGEEEIKEEKAVSPNVIVLKGLPVPEGKHLRFPEEEED